MLRRVEALHQLGLWNFNRLKVEINEYTRFYSGKLALRRKDRLPNNRDIRAKRGAEAECRPSYVLPESVRLPLRPYTRVRIMRPSHRRLPSLFLELRVGLSRRPSDASVAKGKL